MAIVCKSTSPRRRRNCANRIKSAVPENPKNAKRIKKAGLYFNSPVFDFGTDGRKIFTMIKIYDTIPGE